MNNASRVLVCVSIDRGEQDVMFFEWFKVPYTSITKSQHTLLAPVSCSRILGPPSILLVLQTSTYISMRRLKLSWIQEFVLVVGTPGVYLIQWDRKLPKVSIATSTLDNQGVSFLETGSERQLLCQIMSDGPPSPEDLGSKIGFCMTKGHMRLIRNLLFFRIPRLCKLQALIRCTVH